MGTQPALSIVEILGIATSISLLAGWRLYLVVLVTGVAMRTGLVPLPEHLASLQVFGNPWIMAVAAIGAFSEFFTDKIAWLDSAWDAVHTLLRPVGGALLAMAVIDPADPTTQVLAVLLGGGGALLSHTGKAGVRAIVNTSPEPISNVGVSLIEDGLIGALLVLAFTFPVVAAVIALCMAGLAIALIVLARRVVRRLMGTPRKQAPDPQA